MNIISRKISHKVQHVLMLGIILVCFISLFAPAVSRAATPTTPPSYTLLEPLPCLDNSTGCTVGQTKDKVDFETYVNYMFTLFIALSAVAAVFMIVWGGFKYTTTDSYSGKSEGKQVIFNALQGLLLVLCSYLILRTIDPRLVAIPSTLVPALAIPCSTNKDGGPQLLASDPNCKSLTEDYFDTLAAEANKYQVNAQQANANRDAAKKIESELLLQKADLEKKLQDAIKNNDQKQIDGINAQIANTTNNLSDNRAKIQTQQAIGMFNTTLTTLAANANQNQLSETDVFLTPGAAADTRKGNLETIGIATKNMYNEYTKTYTAINDPKNPQAPQYTSDLIKNGDDALLKATQIYVETYNKNKPADIGSTQDGILNLLKYKNSFTLSDQTKNEEKNSMILTLCKQEMGSIRQDPNLCK